MIIVFYAFSREVAALKGRFETRSALNVAGLKGFRGRVAGAEVVAVATGMGPERARISSRRTFEQFPRARLAISTGVAGALSEGLVTGDLIVADRLIPTESAMIEGGQTVAVSQELRNTQDALRAGSIRFSTGPLLTSTHPVMTPLQKRRAKSETGSIAVDMESAVIGDQARIRGIPFACVRAVLDTADEEIVGAEVADEDGRVRPLRVASFIIQHPGALLKFPRLARNMAIASRSIAAAIEAIVRRTASERA